MKPRNEEQKLVEAQGQTKTKKPRFKIEKLEERIAPKHGGRHSSGDLPVGRCTDRHLDC